MRIDFELTGEMKNILPPKDIVGTTFLELKLTYMLMS